MPETDTIPVSASIASTGKSIRYIGDHAYAYSGSVGVDNNETTLLEFTTGAGYITAIFQPFYFQTNETDNIKYDITFNDILIAGLQLTDATAYTPYEAINLIIPARTMVKVTALNTSTTASRAVGVSITGRVYGAE